MGSSSIAIIGAGIAGLSAGCYGRMSGFDTKIFEMHDKPGGVCTSWKRKEYVFDGCIHWLVGSKPGSEFNRIWVELGGLDGRGVVDHEEFFRIEGEDGKAFIVYTNADRLERHMKELAPADAELIEQIASDIKLLARMHIPIEKPRELIGPVEGIKMLPSLIPFARPLLRWRGVTTDAFSVKFKDPFLRYAFQKIFDIKGFPMLAALMTLAWLHKRDAGYPLGGSLEFSRAIEGRYLNLGGEINYKSRVEKILVENDRAVGVRLEDGTEHTSDIVISAADSHSTIFDMLEERYIDEEIRRRFATFPLFPPLIQVSVGAAMDLSREPHAISFPLGEPVIIAGKSYDRISFRHFCFDPHMAPEGKSAIVVYLESDYDYWKTLSADKKRYKAEKENAAEKVVQALDSRLPGLKEKVEVVDVATPLTYVRYTGNWRASFEGWLIDNSTSKYMMKGLKRELPGLSSFFMIGQWLAPGGGLPPAAQHGREIIQVICNRDGRPFSASVT